MRKFNEKRVFAAAAMMMLLAVVMSVSVSADASINDVVRPIVEFLDSLMTPLLLIVGSLGALYCVFLGIKFAKAEEPQDREKAKSHLKNAVIGFVLIFVLMLVLKLLMPVMIDWVKNTELETVATILRF
ncbi:MAG: pilin [Clostridia bacterium]|nr:pilin [Clostridia bacterium]